MKLDWHYTSEDKARVNIALIASEVINKLTKEGTSHEIIGVCMLMNALMDSIGGEDGDE